MSEEKRCPKCGCSLMLDLDGLYCPNCLLNEERDRNIIDLTKDFMKISDIQFRHLIMGRIEELKQEVQTYRTYQNNCSYTDNIKSVLKESNELLMRFIHSTKTMNIDEPWKDIVESFKNELQQLLLKLEGSEKANMAEEGVKNPSMVIKRDNIPADSKEPSNNNRGRVITIYPAEYIEVKLKKEPSKCEFCGRDLIFYNNEWICGHGCTKPALKPEKEPIADPCNPCIYNNLISCNICDYYIASHKKKPEFESKIIMDDGRVIPWSEYKKEKEGILGSKSIPSDMPVKSQTRTSKEPFCCHSTGLGRCEVTGEDCKIGSTDYCPKEKEPSDEITEQLKRCEECKQLLKVAISEELIGEFRDDWNFIQSKIDWYLDQVAEKKITIDIMEIMIFFYLNSRGRKWQKR